ncbi:MAG: hypothetical protein MJ211_06345 [Bacteroidales bacterium]|nr:hypothetical protein [Bacteroidales bacterium]
MSTENRGFKYLFKNFFWDMILMIVLILNFLWIFFDWIFSIPWCQSLFLENTPSFYNFYYPINQNFNFYDLIFVAIYLSDLIVGWVISIKRKKKHWLDYPISHWYDILGCIPSGSLLIFRLLRVFSIFVRLDKMKVVDLQKIYLVKKIIKIFNIIIEEVSDRVVVNVLHGIRNDFSEGRPISKSIMSDIVEPQKNKVIDLFFNRFTDISSETYLKYKDDLKQYISLKAKDAVNNNKEISKLTSMPVIGHSIKSTLEKSISQTAFDTINGVIQDVVSLNGTMVLKDITNKVVDSVFQDLQDDFGDIVKNIVVSSLDLIEKETKVKQWRIDEINDDILRLEAKNNPEKYDEYIQYLKQKRTEILYSKVIENEIE